MEKETTSRMASDHLGAAMMPITLSLHEFQSEYQRNVLDTVAQIRKCGLEAVLPLPQLVVCGDQSSGKSSVLEALTEIPFPRNDNLCTRFATEITLRRAPADGIRLCIIPAEARPAAEKAAISAFSDTISDFAEFPAMMNKAMVAMGLQPTVGESDKDIAPRAFARDILSLEIEGPTRPQLTIVDVPGLIQNATKGVTEEDKATVADITHFYITQRRTICLAVISATNDYANQPILTQVRATDPEGSRTLGLITKPDRLDAHSGSEAAFLALARNEDVFFKLGWHVVKNRQFEEKNFSIGERNASESAFFAKSNFKCIPEDCRGIDALRTRLSGLLFDHIKSELPHLYKDLETALRDVEHELEKLGEQRSSTTECRNYLTTLSLGVSEISRAAIDGYYNGDYFKLESSTEFNTKSERCVRRFRAVIQHLNREYVQIMREKGPKFFINTKDPEPSAFGKPSQAFTAEANKTPFAASFFSDGSTSRAVPGIPPTSTAASSAQALAPTKKRSREVSDTMNHAQALRWVGRVMVRARGQEPIGNYNPLVIAELFWELSANWGHFAEEHIDSIADACAVFMQTLLAEKCSKEIHARIASFRVNEALRARKTSALRELQEILRDNRECPMVYNHYYTDNIQKSRDARLKKQLTESLVQSKTDVPGFESIGVQNINVTAAVATFVSRVNRDMSNYSSEEALDCVLSIYKVQQKTFVANITTQVIQRHMVRGLDHIFSPLDVNAMSDADVLRLAAEQPSVRRQRAFLVERKKKLIDAKRIFRDVLGAGAQ